MATTRQFMLDIVGAPPPTISYTRPRGVRWVEIDLESAFHHGHIDIWSRPPVIGANPLLDLYKPMLTDDDEFRLLGPHASGDHAVDEGHRLGRILGRAYLSQAHSFRWFADIKLIVNKTYRGWSITRPTDANGKPEPGTMPDWLVIRRGQAAIAEAKGTQTNVTATSKILGSQWRPQVKRVAVSTNGRLCQLKTWIVATRYVTTEHPRTQPKIYAEDPPAEGEINMEEMEGLEYFGAVVHTARNLRRIGLVRAAARMERNLGSGGNDAVGNEPVRVWKCIAPGLRHKRFIGNIIFPSGAHEAFARYCPFGPWVGQESMEAAIGESLRDAVVNQAWFDGLWLDVPQQLMVGSVPEPWPEENAVTNWPDGSFLSDGSLLVPLAWMEPIRSREQDQL